MQKLLVGTVGTEQVGSDRYPIVVTKVISEKKVQISGIDYHAKSPDFDYYSNQIYEYYPDVLIGPKKTLTLRKDGRWHVEGQSIRTGRLFGFGVANAYQNQSY